MLRVYAYSDQIVHSSVLAKQFKAKQIHFIPIFAHVVVC